MKKLIASVFALSLLGATAASADSVGVHVGDVGVHVGDHHYHHWHDRDWGHRGWHHRWHHHWHGDRHCYWHHHHRICRW